MGLAQLRNGRRQTHILARWQFCQAQGGKAGGRPEAEEKKEVKQEEASLFLEEEGAG